MTSPCRRASVEATSLYRPVTEHAATAPELDVDVLILGWGKGGKILAKSLGAAGRRVALVERDPGMVGGTCINIACAPTKALVHRAGERRPGDDPDTARPAAWDFRDALTDRLRAANQAMLEPLDSVLLVQGQARFTGEWTVEVTPWSPEDGLDPAPATDAAEGERLVVRAEHVVVNTGAYPLRPDMPGARLPGVHDSTTLQLDLPREAAPGRAIVVGSGPVGLEFASLLAGLGVDTTVLVRGEGILPDEDDDVRDSVVAALTDRGVRLRTGASAAVEEADGALRVRLEKGEPVATDIVLFATGRAPATEGLDLAAAGIEADEPSCAWTISCAPRPSGSGRSATSTAARSRPASPSTTTGSCWTS